MGNHDKTTTKRYSGNKTTQPQLQSSPKRLSFCEGKNTNTDARGKKSYGLSWRCRARNVCLLPDQMPPPSPTQSKIPTGGVLRQSFNLCWVPHLTTHTRAPLCHGARHRD